MKKTAYRFLCMVLTICMLCTMSAFTALAEDTVDATIVYGTAYKLPTTVGNVTDIEWNGSVDATKFGTQTITGTGTGGEVTYTVKVAAPKVVYKNNFDSYPTGAGSTAYYESSDKFLKLYSDGGADGSTIVEETGGNKYFKAGPSTSMSMYSVLQPQGIIDGKVAMRFRFRGVDLKGESRDIFTIYVRDNSGNTVGYMTLRGGSDGNPGDNVEKTRYLYPRYSVDGQTWTDAGYVARDFNNGDTGWINLTLVLDQTAGTYSLYGENAVVFENVRFYKTDSTYTANSKKAYQLCITRRNMSGQTTGYACIDDFMYLDLNEASLSYPQSNAAVTQATVNAAVGEAYALPSAVSGIDVKWNQQTVDTSKIGRQVVTGKNDFGQDVTLAVNVGEAISPYNMDFDKYSEGSVGDFESTSLGDGLIIRSEDKGEDKISIISDDIQGKALKIGPGKTSYDSGLDFSDSPVVDSNPTLSFKIKPVSTGSDTWTYPGLIDVYSSYSDNNRLCRLHLYWGSNGGTSLNTQVLFRNETASGYESEYYIAMNFSNGTPGWLDVKLVFDHAKQTYDVYVGGEKKATGQKYYDTKPDTQIGAILFHSKDAQGYFMMDDVKITKSLRTVSGNLPVEPVSIEVGLGTNENGTFALPLEMSDGQSRDFTVSYTVDTSTPGYKSAVGTVEGFDAETVLINAKVLSYKPVDFVFEKDGSTSAQPENGGKLQSINVKRYTASNDDAVMMVAVYDNDVLKSVTPADITNAVLGEEKSIDLNIALPADVTNLDIRTFILDGKDTLKPIDLDSYWESSKKKPVIYLAGDSTTEDVYAQSGGDYTYPRTGWGEKLSNYIDTDKYVIDNRGKSGRSTKSYIDEGRLDDILEDISVGDYLFINFGHNDQATNDPSRGTTVAQYKENLKTYINRARSKGANPVLVTSVPRLVYKVNGTEVWGHQYTGTTPAVDYYGYENLKDRTDAMKAVATEMSVPYLDLNMLMADHIRDLSIEDAKDIYMILAHDDSRFINDARFAVSKFNKNGRNYDETYASNNDHDTTHLNYYGADLCASFVAKEIKEKMTSLAAALTNYTVTKPVGW